MYFEKIIHRRKQEKFVILSVLLESGFTTWFWSATSNLHIRLQKFFIMLWVLFIFIFEGIWLALDLDYV